MVRRYTIRGERSDNLKTSAEMLEESFAPSSVPFANRKGNTADAFDSIRSESASRPAKPGSVHRWELNSFRLGNPACVRRSIISPAALQDEPSGFELRKT